MWCQSERCRGPATRVRALSPSGTEAGPRARERSSAGRRLHEVDHQPFVELWGRKGRRLRNLHVAVAERIGDTARGEPRPPRRSPRLRAPERFRSRRPLPRARSRRPSRPSLRATSAPASAPGWRPRAKQGRGQRLRGHAGPQHLREVRVGRLHPRRPPSTRGFRAGGLAPSVAPRTSTQLPRLGLTTQAPHAHPIVTLPAPM